MKKITFVISVLVVSLLFLSACAPAEDSEPQLGGQSTQAPGTDVAPDTGASPDEGEQQQADPAPAGDVPAELGQQDPVIRGAHVIPETGRENATLLSELLNYQVADLNGTHLGTVDNYVLNLCEAHIIYIVMEADRSLELQGELVVVPYEAVTLEGGVIDVDSQTIFLNFEASQLAGATAYQDRIHLADLQWEADARGYWSEMMNLSNLTTECRVPAQDGQGRQPIVRISYATEVLGAELVNGLGEQIGHIEEVVIVPESGWMRLAAIRSGGLLQAGQGLLAAPPGALSIYSENEGEDLVLVLLVEDEVLENSPRIESLPETDPGWEGRFFDYWSQYLPMTREDLP
jgi:sporulation protein YlmC with PRC-barrel domain